MSTKTTTNRIIERDVSKLLTASQIVMAIRKASSYRTSKEAAMIQVVTAIKAEEYMKTGLVVLTYSTSRGKIRCRLCTLDSKVAGLDPIIGIDEQNANLRHYALIKGRFEVRCCKITNIESINPVMPTLNLTD